MDRQPDTKVSTPAPGRSHVLGVVVCYGVPAPLLAAGLGLWAYTGAWLTPAVERIDSGDSDPGELHIWVQEQRELAVVLAVVGLVLVVMRRRGPVGIPALGVFAGLLTVDCIVDAGGWSGWGTTAVMLVVGGALSGIAWASTWFGRRPAGSLLMRRVAAVVAIVAALLTPALGPNFEDVGDFKRLPIGLVPSGVVVMALLWCAALTAASVARTTPPSTRAVAGYLVAPAVVLAGAGALVDGAVPLLAAPLLALVVVTAIRGRGWVDRKSFVLLVIAGAVASIPYLVTSIAVAEVLGAPLMAAAGYEYPADGVPFVPGALLIALGAGLLLARLAVPQPPVQELPV